MSSLRVSKKTPVAVVRHVACDVCGAPSSLLLSVAAVPDSMPMCTISKFGYFSSGSRACEIDIAKMGHCLFWVELLSDPAELRQFVLNCEKTKYKLFVLDLGRSVRASIPVGRCFFSNGSELHYSHENDMHYYYSLELSRQTYSMLSWECVL